MKGESAEVLEVLRQLSNDSLKFGLLEESLTLYSDSLRICGVVKLGVGCRTAALGDIYRKSSLISRDIKGASHWLVN
jgi:hypothetical protein